MKNYRSSCLYINRPPIVAIMGHVDHGKTSIMDALRSINTIDYEVGKITQYMNAYKVFFINNKIITLIDTPGHEAFYSMRVKGVNITDIVILVISADDGIKDQTIEIIKYTKLMKIPIIIAINKIDKIDNQVNQIKNELSKYGLISKDMGGNIEIILLSVIKKKGLENLRKSILIYSDYLKLNVNYNSLASGVILDSKIHKSKGIISFFLIKEGILKVSDIVVIKNKYFKVRKLIYNENKSLHFATPSTPVEVMGLNYLPSSGDNFFVVEDIKIAKKCIESNSNNELLHKKKNKILSINSFLKNKNKEVINLIVKSDINGTLDAIINIINNISNDYVSTHIVRSLVGDLSVDDIKLASITNSIILCFNVSVSKNIINLAKIKNINIKRFNVVYDIIDFLEVKTKKFLPSKEIEKTIGKAKVMKIFNIKNIYKIAGCIVTNGLLKAKSCIKLIRDNKIIYKGRLFDLKRFKNDVKIVKLGLECGLSIENYNSIEINDQIESFEMIKDNISNKIL